MNRRHFLKNTSAAGTGLALTAPWIPRAADAVSDRLRVGLVGAGLRGEALVNACLDTWEVARVQLAAVCDVWEGLNLQRMVELLGQYDQSPRAYTDLGVMLASEQDLDAVLIATPDFLHARQAVACLEAGLAVYCEAPMANDLAGAQAMVRAARSTGRPLQIGYQRRSNPCYRHCLDPLLRSVRLLGKLTAANGQTNHGAEPDLGWSRRRALDDASLKRLGYASMHAFKNWRWYRDLGGGPLLDYGAHQLDVLNWYLGTPPKAVSARGGTFYYDPNTHQWHDTVMALLEYRDGERTVTAAYQLLTANGYRGKREIFLGDQGSIELSETSAGTAVYRDPKTPDWDRWVELGLLRTQGAPPAAPIQEGVIHAKPTQPPARYELPVEMVDPYPTPHLTNFFDAVQGRGQLNCPPESAYVTQVTVLKIYEAITAGCNLELSPADFQV